MAAGSSSRMGQSKQLLLIDGDVLLRRTIKTILEGDFEDTVVVLGSNEQKHKEVIRDLPVHIVSNPNWAEGMGTSIKAGMEFILRNWPETEALIILVCDQPHLESKHLLALASAHRPKLNPIVASAYGNTIGVPVLFGKEIFNQLSSLENTAGAKKIIQDNMNQVLSLPFPLGEIDLDTMEDYNTFIK